MSTSLQTIPEQFTIKVYKRRPLDKQLEETCLLGMKEESCHLTVTNSALHNNCKNSHDDSYDYKQLCPAKYVGVHAILHVLQYISQEC